MKILILSTAVSAIGSGAGGGVEYCVKTLPFALRSLGHHVDIVAPKGTQPSLENIKEIEGECQPSMQLLARDSGIFIPENSALENMLRYAYENQDQYDVCVNLSYDWLAFYLSSFFKIPFYHFISMGSFNDAMDRIICQTAQRDPYRCAFLTQEQVDSYSFNKDVLYRIIKMGIPMQEYTFCEDPEDYFIWVGRISPEKGLEDAIQVAKLAKITLNVIGYKQDHNYFNQVFKDAKDVNYLGFHTYQEVQKRVRKARALLMTPKSLEAFGNVGIEALACGTPVISYQRGGVNSYIQHGKNGFLVNPCHPEAMVNAINQVNTIDRHFCRKSVESEYDIDSFANRFLEWLST